LESLLEPKIAQFSKSQGDERALWSAALHAEALRHSAQLSGVELLLTLDVNNVSL
jgi:hypothetical protein